MYVKDSIQCNILKDSNFEIVWVYIRPNRLPREIPCIIIGTLYHPPSANNQEILDHLLKCLSIIESRFANCGVILLGDFNNLRRLPTVARETECETGFSYRLFSHDI